MLDIVCELFLWLAGLCVGSFLNVVIYRLPAGLSIAHPARSFCPSCRAPIAWYDNLPLLSWLVLRGRCRRCHASISVQYPLIEALTGLVFVLIYHLLFVSPLSAGLALTLPGDLPLLFLWLALASGLIACAAMDVVSYMVDVRITLFVLVAALIVSSLWPRPDLLAWPGHAPTGAAAVAMLLVAALALWLSLRHAPEGEAEAEPNDDSHAPAPPETAPVRLAAWLFVFVLVLVVVGLVLTRSTWRLPGFTIDLLPTVSLVLLFLLTVIVGGQQRTADDEIREVLAEEQPTARRTVFLELLWLLPILAAGVLAFLAVQRVPLGATLWHALADWAPTPTLRPISGLAFAAWGAVVGAAAGWTLRIFFTLALGREAFGVGDIYILAAAGAAAGWDIALLGLLMSVGIALAGWMCGLLLKSTALIPFGPWLALGFAVALCVREPATRALREHRENLRFAWEQRPEFVVVGIGLMLFATGVALLLARLIRNWAVPDAPPPASPSDDAAHKTAQP